MAQDFDGVLETIKRNRAQPSIEQEELEGRECPIHMVPLEENSRGELSCPFGHVYSGESNW